MANISSINGNPIVVGASGISDGAVGAAKLATNAVVMDKLGNDVIQYLNDEYVELPREATDAEFVTNVGMVSRVDLSVYSSGDSYTGRYTTISVVEGERYLISGYSQNSTYPCCFGVAQGGTTAVIPLLLSGNGITYVDSEVIIPEGVVTIYVNGNTNSTISIKKISKITQNEAQAAILNAKNIGFGSRLKAVYDGSNLKFKTKFDASRDLVITMGHDGGNDLFTFKSAYKVDNSDAYIDNNFAYNSEPQWGMRQSDWFGPYTVAAASNPDGDHPTDKYFTGGNHRSNNASSGGGITATETSFTITFDGAVPNTNIVYDVSEIKVVWTNKVQAYNTSKDDGSGRAVLQETWTVLITPDILIVENEIVPLEDVVIKKYYGIQAYVAGMDCIFVGGEDRARRAVSAGRNSGNKTCRSIVGLNDNYSVEMGVDPIDLGLFANSEYSAFSSGNKLYFNLVNGTDVQAGSGEHYYLRGFYKFD